MTISNQSVPSMFSFVSGPLGLSDSTIRMWSLQVRTRTVSPFGRVYRMDRPNPVTFVKGFPFCLIRSRPEANSASLSTIYYPSHQHTLPYINYVVKYLFAATAHIYHR